MKLYRITVLFYKMHANENRINVIAIFLTYNFIFITFPSSKKSP